jgi:thioredoxin 1
MKKNVVLLSAVCLLSFSGCQFFQDWFGKKDEAPKQEAVAPEAMPAEIKKMTSKDQFEADVLKATMPVVVKFESETCGICKETAPIFQKAADLNKGKVKFVTVNVTEQTELANIHNVKGVPAFLFFNKEGRMIDRIDGGIQEADFIEKVNNLPEK